MCVCVAAFTIMFIIITQNYYHFHVLCYIGMRRAQCTLAAAVAAVSLWLLSIFHRVKHHHTTDVTRAKLKSIFAIHNNGLHVVQSSSGCARRTTDEAETMRTQTHSHFAHKRQSVTTDTDTVIQRIRCTLIQCSRHADIGTATALPVVATHGMICSALMLLELSFYVCPVHTAHIAAA